MNGCLDNDDERNSGASACEIVPVDINVLFIIGRKTSNNGIEKERKRQGRLKIFFTGYSYRLD
jgi:hypothetical protein